MARYLIHDLLLWIYSLYLEMTEWLAIVWVVSRATFNSTIVLTLTGEGIVLCYDVAVSVAERRASSLIACSNPVVVSKIMHSFDILFGFSLLLIRLLLLLLGYLGCQVSFVFTFLLFFLNQFPCLGFALRSDRYHILSRISLTVENSESIVVLGKAIRLLVDTIDKVGPTMLISLFQCKLIWRLVSGGAHYLCHALWF